MEINLSTNAALNSVAATTSAQSASVQSTNSTTDTAQQSAPTDNVTISTEAQRLLAAEQQSSGGTYTPANTGLEPPPPTRPKQEH